MTSFSIQVDLSFVQQTLVYLAAPSSTGFQKLLAHPAAQGVHSHALRFGNTEKDLVGFWEERLAGVNKDTVDRARVNMDFLEDNPEEFMEAFDEVTEYLPQDLKLRCHLYAIIEYDVGIVSDGDAYINLAHILYTDKRELVYMAMHEVHHVAYTHYHPIYSFSDLKTTDDLRDIVMYSTHLEGLAVYTPYDKRRREDGLNHVDYRLYLDQSKRDQILKDYFMIWEELSNKPARNFKKSDFGTIEKLSSERLWYVAGLHMSKTIDEKLGRETLNETIKTGPRSFFAAYESTR